VTNGHDPEHVGCALIGIGLVRLRKADATARGPLPIGDLYQRGVIKATFPEGFSSPGDLQHTWNSQTKVPTEVSRCRGGDSIEAVLSQTD